MQHRNSTRNPIPDRPVDPDSALYELIELLAREAVVQSAGEQNLSSTIRTRMRASSHRPPTKPHLRLGK